MSRVSRAGAGGGAETVNIGFYVLFSKVTEIANQKNTHFYNRDIK